METSIFIEKCLIIATQLAALFLSIVKIEKVEKAGSSTALVYKREINLCFIRMHPNGLYTLCY